MQCWSCDSGSDKRLEGRVGWGGVGWGGVALRGVKRLPVYDGTRGEDKCVPRRSPSEAQVKRRQAVKCNYRNGSHASQTNHLKHKRKAFEAVDRIKQNRQQKVCLCRSKGTAPIGLYHSYFVSRKPTTN